MKLSMVLLGVIGIGLVSIDSMVYAQWTCLYKRVFSTSDRIENSRKDMVRLHKVNTPRFNQLIFSFNACRPLKGFFRFKVQVRNAHSHQWYPPHTMMEWGATMQHSFKSVHPAGSSLMHVRLELPKGAFADGLRVWAEAHGGASLDSIVGLFVNTVDLSRFSETKTVAVQHMPSIMVHNVPKISQMVLDHPKKEVMCSPTSCAMVSSFLTGTYNDPVEFARYVYDYGLETFGSWPFNIAQLFIQCEHRYLWYVRRLSSFNALWGFLKRNMPVIVSVRGYLPGAPKEYLNGHLLVVVGWDATQKKVLCYDPAFEAHSLVNVWYPFDAFMNSWEKSRCLAYCCVPRI